MKNTISEQEMVIKFCKTLEREWKIFAVEVPLFHRSIDVVFTDNSWKYYAIEFKLKNWKQAIEQAKDYMMWADFTFICIPKNVFSSKVKEAFVEYWFGIIIFDEIKEEFEIAINPIKRDEVFKGAFLIERWFRYACDNNNYQYLLSLS